MQNFESIDDNSLQQINGGGFWGLVAVGVVIVLVLATCDHCSDA